MLTGGIGSQLFQITAGRAICERSNQELVFDTSWLRLSRHKHNLDLKRYLSIGDNERWGRMLPLPLAAPALVMSEKTLGNMWNVGKSGRIHKHNDILEDKFLQSGPYRFLAGNFAHNDPFAHLINEASKIRLQLPVLEEISKDLREVLQNPYCAVHARGGDYFALRDSFGVLGEAYFKRAIDLVPKDQPLVWLTNDFEYATKMAKIFRNRESCVINDSHMTPFSSLAIFSEAATIVSANSAFSFWGSYLNSKVTLKVGPRNYTPSMNGNWMLNATWVAVDSDFIK